MKGKSVSRSDGSGNWNLVELVELREFFDEIVKRRLRAVESVKNVRKRRKDRGEIAWGADETVSGAGWWGGAWHGISCSRT